MNLGSVAGRVLRGETVTFQAFGGSMEPRVSNGDFVTVKPRVEPCKKGDVVLAKVNGRWYLHLVSAVSHGGRRVQISNSRGHVNGWTAASNAVGILTP